MVICLSLALPTAPMAQGFAGLGVAGEGFEAPERGVAFAFPQDHGPHPGFGIEWWYVTANMTGPDGTAYGLQWTLFRSALAPFATQGWDSPQVWMGHAAVTTPDAHYVTERLARDGIGQAGVTAQPFEAWIDDWMLAGPNFDSLRMTASAPEFAYDVTLDAQGPLTLHGDNGFSVKSGEGQASYYYSQPFYALAGTLTLPTGDVAVTGSAWLDREWSSAPLSQSQTGWDWFSLSFEDGTKLMGFQLREGDAAGYSYASWITADGQLTPFEDGALVATALTQTTVAGRQVPTGWRVELPARGVDVTVSALNPQSWMGVSIPYWEGPVTVVGSHSGVGYLEMTGYE